MLLQEHLKVTLEKKQQRKNKKGGKTMEEVMPKAEATLKYARISSRKVKIVADLIRGKNVDEALAIVKYVPKASSEIIEKSLKSAINTGGKDVATVTVQLAVWLPSSVVTVIFALPVATPVTTPLLTVATDALFELHVTFLFTASAGATVAVRVIVLPCFTDADVLLRVTPVAGTGAT